MVSGGKMSTLEPQMSIKSSNAKNLNDQFAILDSNLKSVPTTQNQSKCSKRSRPNKESDEESDNETTISALAKDTPAAKQSENENMSPYTPIKYSEDGQHVYLLNENLLHIFKAIFILTEEGASVHNQTINKGQGKFEIVEVLNSNGFTGYDEDIHSTGS